MRRARVVTSISAARKRRTPSRAWRSWSRISGARSTGGGRNDDADAWHLLRGGGEGENASGVSWGGARGSDRLCQRRAIVESHYAEALGDTSCDDRRWPDRDP